MKRKERIEEHVLKVMHQMNVIRMRKGVNLRVHQILAVTQGKKNNQCMMKNKRIQK